MIEAVAEEVAGLSAHGVISAFRTGADPMENVRRHAELGDALRAYGFDPVQGTGHWDGVPELNWTVPGIPVPVLVSLGRRFSQEAVLHVRADGTKVVIRLT